MGSKNTTMVGRIGRKVSAKEGHRISMTTTKKEEKIESILLSDDQRRRLAVRGKILGRKRTEEAGTVFTPEIIFRCHRTLVAAKDDYSERRKMVRRQALVASCTGGTLVLGKQLS